MNGNKANARIRVEQNVDLVSKNMQLKILGQSHDQMLMTTDPRYKHYKANEDLIILRDGLFFKKYFAKTGGVKYYQIPIPKQLVIEVVRSLQREFGKHPGIAETIIAYREKIISQKWRNYSGKGSVHVRNVSYNHELTVASPAFP